MPEPQNTSGRVTPSKARVKSRSTSRSIDEILAEEGEAPKQLDEIPTVTKTVFGEDFRVLKTINILNILSLGSEDAEDSAQAVHTVLGMIHPEDRKRFKNAYASQLELSGKALSIIIREFIQAAAGDANPTNSSSGSGPSANRATRRALSKGN